MKNRVLLLSFTLFALLTGAFSHGQSFPELTEKEQQWLKEKNTVRIRVGDWPPFMICEDGEFSGISLDLIQQIFNTYSISYEFISPREFSWSEALDCLKRKECIDLLPTAKITEERARFMLFTREYISPPWVIFTRKDSPFISDLKDFAGKTLSVQYGFYMQDLLSRNYPEIRLRVYDGPDATFDSMKALAVGEVDGFVENLATGSYLINKEHLYDLKVAAPAPFGNHSNAMAVRSDWPELVSIINKGLDSITQAEQNAIFGKYYSVEYDFGVRTRDILKWVLLVVLMGVVISLIFLRSYFRLNREILLRQKLQGELSEYISMVDRNILTLKFNCDWIITKVSEALCRVSGFDKNEILGRRLKELVDPSIQEEWFEHRRSLLKDNQIVEGEICNRKKDGTCYWMKYQISPSYNLEKEKIGYTLIGQDITDRKKVEALSVTDKLTGISNRMKLDEVFSYEIRLSRRGDRLFTILLSDLDGFKKINDLYGHSTGDRYLCAYAGILKQHIRCSDTLGRWGGDEFLIICPDLKEEQAHEVVGKLQHALREEPFEDLGCISASFGIASFREGDDEILMLNRADKDLYRNKRRKSAGPENK